MTLANIDQVLLQRIVPERVFHLKYLRVAVLIYSRYPEVVSLLEQTRFYTVELNRHVIEAPSTLAELAGCIAFW